jgi:hypothetical protein
LRRGPASATPTWWEGGWVGEASSNENDFQ